MDFELEYLDEIYDDNEADLNADLNNFYQAVIWGTDWTTETIANQLIKGNIDLSPKFQRRDAWDNREKSRLIESLILGLPVPPIILAENKLKRNSYIVIDGKQRLLSIRMFYAGCKKLENSENLNFDKAGFKKLKLGGLEILKNINSYTYNDVFRHSPDYIDLLDNQTIRTIVIKNWPDESFLYTVFLRLNTGSKKLSPQELRQALRPGMFLQYLDEATSASRAIMKMLNNSGPDKRMKDIELALRYYAYKYCLDIYNGNLKEFLDTTCDILNKNWDTNHVEYEKAFQELENAIEFSYEIISNESPFSRVQTTKRFNRSIFELFSYYFSIQEIRVLVKRNKKKFLSEFEKLNKDVEFISAISDSTKNPAKVTKRFQLFSKLLNSLMDEVDFFKIPTFKLSSDNHIILE